MTIESIWRWKRNSSEEASEPVYVKPEPFVSEVVGKLRRLLENTDDWNRVYPYSPQNGITHSTVFFQHEPSGVVINYTFYGYYEEKDQLKALYVTPDQTHTSSSYKLTTDENQFLVVVFNNMVDVVQKRMQKKYLSEQEQHAKKAHDAILSKLYNA